MHPAVRIWFTGRKNAVILTPKMAADSHYCEFIEDPEQFLTSLKSLHGRKVAVTQGKIAPRLEDCEARDAEWNHMDQLHRPHVHKTYLNSLRLARGHAFALSFTMFKAAGIPFLVLVSDVRVREGLYYQVFTFFNILHVHIFIEMAPQGGQSTTTVQWYIVSHPIFKLMHGFISRRYRRLATVQGEQDRPILTRRTELRKKGYRFHSDKPDFVTSNTLTSGVCFPKLEGRHRISLKGLAPSTLNKVSAGPVDFLVLSNPSEGGIKIWPAACPHEGGPLALGKVCNGQIECPWHGLKFACAKLSPAHSTAELGNHHFQLESDELIIEEKS